MPDPAQTTPVRRQPRARRGKAAAQPIEPSSTLTKTIVSEEKYQLMKQKLLEAVEQNRMLEEQLDDARAQIAKLRKSKVFLLDRLACTLLSDASSDDDDETITSEVEDFPISLSKSHRELYRAAARRAKLMQRMDDAALLNGSHNVTNGKSNLISPSPTVKEKMGKQNVAISPTAPVPRRAKTTRKRQQPFSERVRNAYDVPKDEEGSYKLPVSVGSVEVLNLGKVVYDRDAFHTERYIWPVGYKVKRVHPSMVVNKGLTTYTCTILDGDDTPLFQVVADDKPDAPITGTSATGVWTAITKEINAIRHRSYTNSISGPDCFGMTIPTVARMIQELPNAELCTRYKPLRFTILQPRSMAELYPSAKQLSLIPNTIKDPTPYLKAAFASQSTDPPAKKPRTDSEVAEIGTAITPDDSETRMTDDPTPDQNQPAHQVTHTESMPSEPPTNGTTGLPNETQAEVIPSDAAASPATTSSVMLNGSTAHGVTMTTLVGSDTTLEADCATSHPKSSSHLTEIQMDTSPSFPSQGPAVTNCQIHDVASTIPLSENHPTS
ncbi:hypothetical protein IWQ61_010013 [Dispira simplex]|nr:hypothetical protein IWQ61_010013 [Dispira simplex]